MTREERLEAAKAVTEIIQDWLQDWVQSEDEYPEIDLVQGIMRDLFTQFDLSKYAVDIWFSDYRKYIMDDLT